MKKQKVLFTQNQIQQKVQEIAKKITDDYFDKHPIIISILNGSFIYLADLVRELDFPLEIDFLRAKSYVGQESTGMVQLVKDIEKSVRDRHIILVEDIIDTGLTLNHIVDHLSTHNPKSIEITAFLVKNEKSELEHEVKYPGFNIPDHFVLGYGMDYNGAYRNLKEIVIMET